jgi:hypothetical protein
MQNVNVLYFRTNVEFEWSARVMGCPNQAKPSEVVVVSRHLRCFGLGTNVLDIFVSIVCV